MTTTVSTCAILTGASGGIGRALLTGLLEQGTHVLAIVRSDRSAAGLRTTPEGLAGQLTILQADLAMATGRQAIVDAVRILPMRPDLVIHAAGDSHFGLFTDQNPEEFNKLFAINVLSPLELTHAVMPLMARGKDVQIVAIGSTFGSIGYPGFAAYCASKFALRGAFEALAREHADDNVKFLYCSPRATRTGLNSPEVDALNAELGNRVDSPEEVADQVLQAIAAGRRRLQIGWPERLLVRLNGAFPGVLDKGIASQLSRIKKHARIVPEGLPRG